MTNSIRKQPITPFLIFSGFLMIALAFFTILKVIDTTELSSAITYEERIYKENENKLAQLELLSLREDELRQSYDGLNKLIPMHAGEDQLINYIKKLSEAVGLDMAMIQFEERVVNNNLNEMPLSLSFEGNYHQLISLVRKMATGERLVRIDQIVIDREDATADGITINMKASAFYR